jgi:hypothetical protein
MGTRLLSEHLIKKHCQQLRYVRIHSNGKNTATIYAWNDDLQLTGKEQDELKRFASGYLLQNVCYRIKPYDSVQTDQVPQVGALPEPILEAAMNRGLNQYRIEAVMNRMFPRAKFLFNRYDSFTGTIHFDFYSPLPVNEREKELVRQYLYEIIPLGSTHEVAYS